MLGTLLCALCGLPALTLALFAVRALKTAADSKWAARALRIALALAIIAIGAHLFPSARHCCSQRVACLCAVSGVLLLLFLLLGNQLAIVQLYRSRLANGTSDTRVACADDCLSALLFSPLTLTSLHLSVIHYVHRHMHPSIREMFASSVRIR